MAVVSDRVLSMRPGAERKQSRGLARIHRQKTRSRKAQIRARAPGKRFEGFCLAKHVAPELLHLSRAKIPADDDA